MSSIKEKFKACLFGVLFGDTLGFEYEFSNFSNEKVFNRFEQLAGNEKSKNITLFMQ